VLSQRVGKSLGEVRELTSDLYESLERVEWHPQSKSDDAATPFFNELGRNSTHQWWIQN
jgi:hypothetical protein